MRVEIDLIRKTLEKKLVDRGMNTSDARMVADEYLEGELQGKYSHGLVAFPSVVGKIHNDQKEAKIIKKTEALVFVDAGENFGVVVGRQVASELMEMAKRQGIAVGLIKNMTTWLRPGTLARVIAEGGFVGIVINTGGSPMVAPPGGYEPVIGTNPMGIGIPTQGAPIVVDMATSKRAWGVVKVAEKAGRDLPEETFYDASGKFTINPKKAYSVASFGDYKGFSIGLVIEMLCGSLLGMPMGLNQLASDYRSLARGAMVLVIDPNLVDVNAFKKANSELTERIEKTKKVKKGEEILVPGERSARRRENNFKNKYLDVEEGLWKEIEEL
jgi:L-2-hydroxycarboxylate dehydrogenase (NAD+)